MNKLSRSAIVAAVLYGFCSVLTAQQYELREIKTLGENMSYVSGINDHLRIVGYLIEKNGQTRSFFWSLSNGAIELGPGDNTYAAAINNNGQVVGCKYFPGGNYDAFLWSEADGLMDLGNLGNNESCAYGINDLGDVTGSASIGPETAHAFLWTKAGGMQDIGASVPTSTAGFGINDNDQIVGYGVFGPFGFVWSKERGIRKLPSLPGANPGIAYGIDNSGQIVGNIIYYDGSGRYPAVRWPHLVGQVPQVLDPQPGPSGGAALGSNHLGQIVGYTSDAATQFGFVWTAETGMQNLNDLIPAGSGWIITSAAAINDAGKIAAVAIKADDNSVPPKRHALLLTPVTPTAKGEPIP